MLSRISRRMLLGLLGAAAARRADAAVPTPPQTEGPFSPPPEQRFADTDWDLVKIEGAVREAGGEVLHLSGRVLGREGAPLAEAPVEIWQCDASGRYLHRMDRQPGERDTAFQGFGRTVTDAEGRYRFRTIRPVPYPGRTPHIHARVGRPDGSWLTTQVYLEGHPLNRTDFLFRRLGRRGQRAASIEPARRADGDLDAAFDFVV
ncbi:MAG TPA: protocatechuate 3,4-dioxygenase [Thermohalobaculum sp.]|nr:protocatechuate 3,4-dioxygenase [Thermohalobaculum sp.]